MPSSASDKPACRALPLMSGQDGNACVASAMSHVRAHWWVASCGLIWIQLASLRIGATHRSTCQKGDFNLYKSRALRQTRKFHGALSRLQPRRPQTDSSLDAQSRTLEKPCPQHLSEECWRWWSVDRYPEASLWGELTRQRLTRVPGAPHLMCLCW
ncbi:hypothetical protein mRhiFer1_009659 [Rhinolophus ferrumequinum]|uniref:Uncharacterized protein n=1 Tax=Rhinolophus ferrumequinum TaxID=59479 RepID=A0A7J7R619_RHIFE|nr:hypothetical protein mRhiFer1_009659 [Rhinolophus ferrumequinum]